MRMQGIFIGLLFLVFLLQSCTKEMSKRETTASPQIQQSTRAAQAQLAMMLALEQAPHRSRAEVLQVAQHNLGVKGQDALRGNLLEIDYVLTPSQTIELTSASPEGSSLVDTMLYIVNKRNNGGFCVLSGDKRLPEILAFSDTGHLDKDSVSITPGLVIFWDLLPLYYTKTLSQFHTSLDSLQLLSKPQRPVDTVAREDWRSEVTEWKIVRKTPNYVPVCWGQGEPFNNAAPKKGGVRATAGCVATATVQLLAAFRYPPSYQGMNFDWDFLTRKKYIGKYTSQERSRFDSQVAFLFRKIGDKLCNSWGKEESSADDKNVPKVLKSMGFRHPSSRTKYNQKGIYESLDYGCPVVMGGYSHAVQIGGLTIPYKGGHAWLCDGYFEKQRSWVIIDNRTEEIVASGTTALAYMHCNWGWYGARNGYLNAGVFDASCEPNYPDRDYELQGNVDQHYQYELTNILYIYP